MRVMHVIDSLGAGGAERSLVEMLGPLEAQGVESLIVCLEQRSVGFHEEAQTRHHVEVLPTYPYPLRVQALRALIKRQDPDIVHSTLIRADLVSRVATLGTGAVHLTSLVNTTYDPRRLSDPNVSRIGLEFYRQVDGFTGRHMTAHFHAITHAVAESNVRALRLDPERVTVVPRGRDPARLGEPSAERRVAARIRLGVPAGAEVIVHVGRQEGQKRIPDLVRAVGALVRQGRPTVLLQAGRDGNDTEAIRRAVTAEGLESQVRLLGHRSDIAEVLAAGDVFGFPSLYEGLGGALIEAMALGLPIVASDIPAIRETVQADANALLVSTSDVLELASALKTVLDNRDLAKAFALQSRSLFLSRYTLARSVEKMAAMYRHQSR